MEQNKRYYIVSGNASFGPYINKYKAKKDLPKIEQKTKKKAKIIDQNSLGNFIWGNV